MDKDKDIINKNSKGYLHGYQEWYGNDDVLIIRGIAKNYETIGYQEWHRAKKTNFHIR